MKTLNIHKNNTALHSPKIWKKKHSKPREPPHA